MSEPRPAVDDPALVTALRAGDPQAFDTLMRTYGAKLLATARRILTNDDEAREAVHEAFISAFRARRGFQGEAKISTWLHRIVVNHPEEPIDDLLPSFRPDGHHAERFTAWTEPVDVALGRKETSAFVRAAIDKLPDSYRTVLLLRDIEEYSTEEAAAALGITPNAAKIRLHRARMALRALLAPRFEEAKA
jgi:RNA polymerase sigma-70 factor (ECF subfamily)